MKNSETAALKRRLALKALSGSALMGGLMDKLPNTWQRPLIHIGALPAHAQSSRVSLQGALQFIIFASSRQEWIQIGYTLREENGRIIAMSISPTSLHGFSANSPVPAANILQSFLIQFGQNGAGQSRLRLGNSQHTYCDYPIRVQLRNGASSVYAIYGGLPNTNGGMPYGNAIIYPGVGFTNTWNGIGGTPVPPVPTGAVVTTDFATTPSSTTSVPAPIIGPTTTRRAEPTTTAGVTTPAPTTAAPTPAPTTAAPTPAPTTAAPPTAAATTTPSVTTPTPTTASPTAAPTTTTSPTTATPTAAPTTTAIPTAAPTTTATPTTTAIPTTATPTAAPTTTATPTTATPTAAATTTPSATTPVPTTATPTAAPTTTAIPTTATATTTKIDKFQMLTTAGLTVSPTTTAVIPTTTPQTSTTPGPTEYTYWWNPLGDNYLVLGSFKTKATGLIDQSDVMEHIYWVFKVDTLLYKMDLSANTLTLHRAGQDPITETGQIAHQFQYETGETAFKEPPHTPVNLIRSGSGVDAYGFYYNPAFSGSISWQLINGPGETPFNAGSGPIFGPWSDAPAVVTYRYTWNPGQYQVAGSFRTRITGLLDETRVAEHMLRVSVNSVTLFLVTFGENGGNAIAGLSQVVPTPLVAHQFRYRTGDTHFTPLPNTDTPINFTRPTNPPTYGLRFSNSHSKWQLFDGQGTDLVPDHGHSYLNDAPVFSPYTDTRTATTHTYYWSPGNNYLILGSFETKETGLIDEHDVTNHTYTLWRGSVELFTADLSQQMLTISGQAPKAATFTHDFQYRLGSTHFEATNITELAQDIPVNLVHISQPDNEYYGFSYFQNKWTLVVGMQSNNVLLNPMTGIENGPVFGPHSDAPQIRTYRYYWIPGNRYLVQGSFTTIDLGVVDENAVEQHAYTVWLEETELFTANLSDQTLTLAGGQAPQALIFDHDFQFHTNEITFRAVNTDPTVSGRPVTFLSVEVDRKRYGFRYTDANKWVLNAGGINNVIAGKARNFVAGPVFGPTPPVITYEYHWIPAASAYLVLGSFKTRSVGLIDESDVWAHEYEVYQYDSASDSDNLLYSVDLSRGMLTLPGQSAQIRQFQHDFQYQTGTDYFSATNTSFASGNSSPVNLSFRSDTASEYYGLRYHNGNWELLTRDATPVSMTSGIDSGPIFAPHPIGGYPMRTWQYTWDIQDLDAVNRIYQLSGSFKTRVTGDVDQTKVIEHAFTLRQTGTFLFTVDISNQTYRELSLAAAPAVVTHQFNFHTSGIHFIPPTDLTTDASGLRGIRHEPGQTEAWAMYRGINPTSQRSTVGPVFGTQPVTEQTDEREIQYHWNPGGQYLVLGSFRTRYVGLIDHTHVTQHVYTVSDLDDAILFTVDLSQDLLTVAGQSAISIDFSHDFKLHTSQTHFSAVNTDASLPLFPVNFMVREPPNYYGFRYRNDSDSWSMEIGQAGNVISGVTGIRSGPIIGPHTQALRTRTYIYDWTPGNYRIEGSFKTRATGLIDETLVFEHTYTVWDENDNIMYRVDLSNQKLAIREGGFSDAQFGHDFMYYNTEPNFRPDNAGSSIPVNFLQTNFPVGQRYGFGFNNSFNTWQLYAGAVRGGQTNILPATPFQNGPVFRHIGATVDPRPAPIVSPPTTAIPTPTPTATTTLIPTTAPASVTTTESATTPIPTTAVATPTPAPTTGVPTTSSPEFTYYWTPGRNYLVLGSFKTPHTGLIDETRVTQHTYTVLRGNTELFTVDVSNNMLTLAGQPPADLPFSHHFRFHTDETGFRLDALAGETFSMNVADSAGQYGFNRNVGADAVWTLIVGNTHFTSTVNPIFGPHSDAPAVKAYEYYWTPINSHLVLGSFETREIGWIDERDVEEHEFKVYAYDSTGNGTQLLYTVDVSNSMLILSDQSRESRDFHPDFQFHTSAPGFSATNTDADITGRPLNFLHFRAGSSYGFRYTDQRKWVLAVGSEPNVIRADRAQTFDAGPVFGPHSDAPGLTTYRYHWNPGGHKYLIEGSFKTRLTGLIDERDVQEHGFKIYEYDSDNDQDVLRITVDLSNQQVSTPGSFVVSLGLGHDFQFHTDETKFRETNTTAEQAGRPLNFLGFEQVTGQNTGVGFRYTDQGKWVLHTQTAASVIPGLAETFDDGPTFSDVPDASPAGRHRVHTYNYTWRLEVGAEPDVYMVTGSFKTRQFGLVEAANVIAHSYTVRYQDNPSATIHQNYVIDFSNNMLTVLANAPVSQTFNHNFQYDPGDLHFTNMSDPANLSTDLIGNERYGFLYDGSHWNFHDGRYQNLTITGPGPVFAQAPTGVAEYELTYYWSPGNGYLVLGSFKTRYVGLIDETHVTEHTYTVYSIDMHEFKVDLSNNLLHLGSQTVNRAFNHDFQLHTSQPRFRESNENAQINGRPLDFMFFDGAHNYGFRYTDQNKWELGEGFHRNEIANQTRNFDDGPIFGPHADAPEAQTHHYYWAPNDQYLIEGSFKTRSTGLLNESRVYRHVYTVHRRGVLLYRVGLSDSLLAIGDQGFRAPGVAFNHDFLFHTDESAFRQTNAGSQKPVDFAQATSAGGKYGFDFDQQSGKWRLFAGGGTTDAVDEIPTDAMRFSDGPVFGRRVSSGAIAPPVLPVRPPAPSPAPSTATPTATLTTTPIPPSTVVPPTTQSRLNRQYWWKWESDNYAYTIIGTFIADAAFGVTINQDQVRQHQFTVYRGMSELATLDFSTGQPSAYAFEWQVGTDKFAALAGSINIHALDFSVGAYSFYYDRGPALTWRLYHVTDGELAVNAGFSSGGPVISETQATLSAPGVRRFFWFWEWSGGGDTYTVHGTFRTARPVRQGDVINVTENDTSQLDSHSYVVLHNTRRLYEVTLKQPSANTPELVHYPDLNGVSVSAAQHVFSYTVGASNLTETGDDILLNLTISNAAIVTSGTRVLFPLGLQHNDIDGDGTRDWVLYRIRNANAQTAVDFISASTRTRGFAAGPTVGLSPPPAVSPGLPAPRRFRWEVSVDALRVIGDFVTTAMDNTPISETNLTEHRYAVLIRGEVLYEADMLDQTNVSRHDFYYIVGDNRFESRVPIDFDYHAPQARMRFWREGSNWRLVYGTASSGIPQGASPTIRDVTNEATAIRFATAAYSGAEGDEVVVQVTKIGPAEVTFSLSRAAESRADAADVSANTTDLTIPANRWRIDIPVQLEMDGQVEPDETLIYEIVDVRSAMSVDIDNPNRTVITIAGAYRLFEYYWSPGYGYLVLGTFRTTQTGLIDEGDVTEHEYTVFHGDAELFTVDLNRKQLTLFGQAPVTRDNFGHDFQFHTSETRFRATNTDPDRNAAGQPIAGRPVNFLSFYAADQSSYGFRYVNNRWSLATGSNVNVIESKALPFDDGPIFGLHSDAPALITYPYYWSPGDNYLVLGSFKTRATGLIDERDVVEHEYTVFHGDTELFTADLSNKQLTVFGQAPVTRDLFGHDFQFDTSETGFRETNTNPDLNQSGQPITGRPVNLLSFSGTDNSSYGFRYVNNQWVLTIGTTVNVIEDQMLPFDDGPIFGAHSGAPDFITYEYHWAPDNRFLVLGSFKTRATGLIDEGDVLEHEMEVYEYRSNADQLLYTVNLSGDMLTLAGGSPVTADFPHDFQFHTNEVHFRKTNTDIADAGLPVNFMRINTSGGGTAYGFRYSVAENGWRLGAGSTISTYSASRNADGPVFGPHAAAPRVQEYTYTWNPSSAFAITGSFKTRFLGSINQDDVIEHSYTVTRTSGTGTTHYVVNLSDQTWVFNNGQVVSGTINPNFQFYTGGTSFSSLVDFSFRDGAITYGFEEESSGNWVLYTGDGNLIASSQGPVFGLPAQVTSPTTIEVEYVWTPGDYHIAGSFKTNVAFGLIDMRDVTEHIYTVSNTSGLLFTVDLSRNMLTVAGESPVQVVFPHDFKFHTSETHFRSQNPDATSSFIPVNFLVRQDPHYYGFHYRNDTDRWTLEVGQQGSVISNIAGVENGPVLRVTVLPVVDATTTMR